MNNLKTIILLVFILPSIILNAQWTQLGNDIDGEATNDVSGAAVSISANGKRVAIGAFGNDGSSTNEGHVRVYENISGSWVQIGNDIDGEATDDGSGISVDISSNGNIVAIGATGNDANGFSSGHVRVYFYNGTNWTQLGSDIDGEAASDASGSSVSLNANGDIVAIGAPYNDDNGNNSGHVRVYYYNGSNWVQMGGDIDGEAAEDHFGESVALSSDGNTLAVGADLNDGNGLSSGHVRVYTFNGSNWVQKGGDIDGEANGDKSGSSVSISDDGNTVAIGAISNNNINGTSGHVRIYNYAASSWSQIGQDIDGEANFDNFGNSVSLNSSGTKLAAAGYANDGNGTDAGHVRCYELIGGVWNQIFQDIDGEAAGDLSGSGVAMDSLGIIVAIGAKNNNDNGSWAGHTRVYTSCVTTTSTINPSACTSYTSPSGNYVWTTSNTYTDTINNAGGCDSIITINLTITGPSNGTDVITTCDSLQWIDGNTYYSNNTIATHTISNGSANGCDSIVTLNLTINSSYHHTDSVAICNGQTYVFPDGAHGMVSTIHASFLTSSTNCDSTIVTTLTVLSVDNTTSNNNDSIMANAVGASYQWLDCDNNYAVIGGATNQLFVASSNGNYAVEVTQNGCADTSVCVNITSIGINEVMNSGLITIYPNPTDGLIMLDFGEINGKASYTITSIEGKVIKQSDNVTSNKVSIDLSNEGKGVYLLKVKRDASVNVMKLIVK